MNKSAKMVLESEQYERSAILIERIQTLTRAASEPRDEKDGTILLAIAEEHLDELNELLAGAVPSEKEVRHG